jgi:hypothetical protein
MIVASRSIPLSGRALSRWFSGLSLGLAAYAVTGCIYDADKPCGDDYAVYGDGVRCVCPEGTAYTPAGCVACGEHEVASASGCACEEGYSRPSADAPCVPTPSDLGAECDPAAPACDPLFDHCEPAGESGYCTTTGCTTNDDCSGGYACNAESVCQRPPVGLGQTCASADDCAGTEATFCESFMTHTCQVQGCQLDQNDCFSGYECCDYSAFGLPQPLCVPEGVCAR